MECLQVREGVVATENLTVNVHVESHPNVLDVRFKVALHPHGDWLISLRVPEICI